MRGPDPGRLLEALRPSERATIFAAARALAIPARTALRVPALRLLAEVLAVETLADRLQAGGPRARAVERACAALRVARGTHERRVERARQNAYNPSRAPLTHRMWGDETLRPAEIPREYHDAQDRRTNAPDRPTPRTAGTPGSPEPDEFTA